MAEDIARYEELLDLIDLLPDSKETHVIAVSGFGGSGKSYLATQLQRHLPGSELVAADDFATAAYTERSADWACIDRQRMIDELLAPLHHGQDATYRIFDWHTNRLGDTRSIKQPKFLILEGVGILHPLLLPLLSLSIWIDVPLERAAERGLLRDIKDGVKDHELLWRNVWVPNDQEYFDRYHPESLADCLYVADPHPSSVGAVA